MLKFLFIIYLFITQVYSHEIIIGKYDRIDLPELNLKKLKAKIDTGAKTSSLHCILIESKDDKYVTFDVLDKTHKKYENKRYTLPIVRIAQVRSSNGIVEKRYVISTKLTIFNNSYDVEFTLRNRKKMNYPILLGREFLENGFLVDVKKEDISFSKFKSK